MMKRLLFCLSFFCLFSSAPSYAKPEVFNVWGRETRERPAIPPEHKEIKREVRKLEGLTPEQEKQGYLVFGRNYLEHIYYTTVPYTHELAPVLKTVVTPGEFEPLTFAVHALEDLKGVKVTIPPLTAENGEKIDEENIDLRVVKPTPKQISKKEKTYFYLPFYLEKNQEVNIPTGTNKQFWLTLYIPPNTKPDVYKGDAIIEVPNKKPAMVEIKVKVLPFKLDKPEINYYLYATAKGTKTKEEWRKRLVDMVSHGLNGGGVGAGIDVRFTKTPFPELVERAKEEFRWRIEVAKEFLDGPCLAGIGSIGIASNWDHGLFWFVPYNFTPERDAKMSKIDKATDEILKETGFSDRAYADVAHEIGGNLSKKRKGHPDLKQMATHYFKLLKDNFPERKTLAHIGGGIGMGLPEDEWWKGVDVFCTNNLGDDPEAMYERLQKGAKEIWFYNMCSGGEVPVIDRHFFGFFAWRMNPRVVSQWVYTFDDISRNQFRGNEGYTATSRYGREGNVPSIGLQAVREGIDDERYIATLENLIEKNSRSPKVKRARKLLTEIRKEVKIKKTAYDAWTGARLGTQAPAQYDRWRWKIAKEIVRLLK